MCGEGGTERRDAGLTAPSETKNEKKRLRGSESTTFLNFSSFAPFKNYKCSCPFAWHPSANGPGACNTCNVQHVQCLLCAVQMLAHKLTTRRANGAAEQFYVEHAGQLSPAEL